jgi:S1-C subfamily serine protease
LATVQGGPAEQAGIRRGDIIISIGDERIQGQTTFTEALFAQSPGDTVTVTALRGNEELQFEVTLSGRQVS